MKTVVASAVLAVVVALPMHNADAAVVAVECGKRGSINAAIAKLDRSVANTLNVTGTCTENVVVSGHRDLTIAGAGSAAVQPANTAADTIAVNGSSRIVLQNLAIAAGTTGVACDDRSACILRTVSITGGTQGSLSLQKQSTADVQGSSLTNSQGTGIGVFGASSVNIGSDAAGTPTTISGHVNAEFGSGSGIFAQDGSFVRFDGGAITGNDTGAVGDRGAVLKLLGTQISGNGGFGVWVRASTLQIAGNVTNNGLDGIWARRLGYVVFAGPTLATGNVGLSVRCDHVTSITQPQNLFSSPVTMEPGRETNCPSTQL